MLPTVQPLGFANVMLVILEQLWNAASPIDVTLLGMVMWVKPVHIPNAYGPIEVTLSGIVKLLRLAQA